MIESLNHTEVNVEVETEAEESKSIISTIIPKIDQFKRGF